MTPQRLLTTFALIVVIIVLTLWLTRDEAFLKPENTGPPEVTWQIPGDSLGHIAGSAGADALTSATRG